MHPITLRLKEFIDIKHVDIQVLYKDLQWKSPEKLYRLFRKENLKPSTDILFDLSKIFDQLNFDWLLTGRGEMIYNEAENVTSVAAYEEKYIRKRCKICLAKDELIQSLRFRIKDKEELIDYLRKENHRLSGGFEG